MEANGNGRVGEAAYAIVVVCHGNICRSPMGEYLLREAFTDAGLSDRVRVESAGTTDDEAGAGMHPRTASVLRRNGHLDIGWDRHRARRFGADWFGRFDLILPVDHVHVRALHRLAPDVSARDKVRLFRSFDPAAVASGDLGMPDPWFGTDPAYDLTYAQVTAAVPGIVDFVREQLAVRGQDAIRKATPRGRARTT